LFRILTLSIGLLLIVGMAGCAAAASTPQSTATSDVDVTTTSTTTEVTANTVTTFGGELKPIVTPTLPEKITGYTDVDPATGLHVTGTAQVIDLASYRLVVNGAVDRELSLTYDDLRRLPKVTATPLLNCPGFFTDSTTWSGVSIKTILEMAGVQPGAARIIMKAADRYSMPLVLDEALNPENFLAYEWMGQPLPVLHGFPLRAVIPSQYGSFWVKWLLEITVE
jgi:DMSO/TMAO reductase YedYZ molybdopterin-dependent catalytic subunit